MFNYKILLFSTLLFCFGCLDEIDLDVPAGVENSIVVRGELLKENPSRIRVTVDRVFNFDLSTLSPFNARAVTLFDEAGNNLDIPSSQDGLHEYVFTGSESIEVDFGKSYSLRVTTFDGRTYESTMEELMPSTEQQGTLESVPSTIEVLDEDNNVNQFPVAQVRINAPLTLPGKDQKARFLWIPERTFKVTDDKSQTCYITNQTDVNSIHVFDGSIFAGDVVNGFELSAVRANFELSEGYYYTVYQRSLTAGAFAYWNQTKQIVERTGSLFEPPAGRVNSNFVNVEDETDNIFGYFTAFAQDTIRLYIDPAQYGFDPEESICPPSVPPPPGGGCAVPVCCDCAILPGSETIRPDFWVE
ncbi:MAG: DUF4249 family protein [Bacteroidota bacterium]